MVGGRASFSTLGSSLSITNSPGAIINWQGFSIGASETTRFIQQSAASSVLNRVIGANPSVILGTLTSNGRVFLINPSGILVGQGARIDVPGLVASTLNLSDQDFLAGRLNFASNPLAGRVENQGSITTPSGGSVYLVGANVTNSGIINSPQGDVILAAGQSVNIFDSSTPGVRVEVTASDNAAVNLGEILAQSGQVGIYGAALRNTGIIDADQVGRDANGKIVLRAKQDVTLEAGSRLSANGEQGGKITVQSETGTTLVSGTIAAKGAAGKGGTIQLLGKRVGLTGASVGASGTAGGGTVLIGGDYQGKNPFVQNASATYVSPDTSVKADAIASGNGGKVIVWSDGSTRAYGNFTARGGAQSGDGGLIETSGHNLDVEGIGIGAGALHGKPGTWLLDPWNVTITTAAVASGAWRVPFPATTIWDTTASGSNVTNTTISGYLNAGTNVSITTTPYPTDAGTEPGNITVSAPILHDSNSAGSPNVTLTLTAGTTGIGQGNIAINDSIGASAGSNVLNVVLKSAGGSVGFGPTGSLSTNGGNVTISAGTSATLGNITTGAGAVTATAGGALTLGGTISANGPGDAVVLAGSSFSNSTGAAAIATPGGRWLVYSTNPASDVKGGLAYNFKQYNLAYSGAAYAGPGAGNGFIYSVAPIITPSLTGTTSKTYDGTTAASLAPANYATSGVLDGDTVLLNNPTSGLYVDKNVGTGKSVTASGLSIASATNGAATVYGYQLASTSASGNIGVISALGITGSITAANKTYDATTAATITGRTLAGAIVGDTVS
ncbi:MAG: two-partner secretion domain-containing protein, partial [Sulfuricella sp.]